MSVNAPPHRPTPEEEQAARDLDLPSDDKYAAAMLEVAGEQLSARAYDNAIKILAALALVRPNDGRVYEAFGAIYLAQGQTDDAESCYTAAFEIDEASPRANLHLGEIAIRKKDRARGERHLRRVLELDDGPFAARAKRSLGE